MAIDMTDLTTLYDNFLTKGLDKLLKLQAETQMEDEFLAPASSKIIIGAMQNSTQAYETLKRGLLLDRQATTEEKKALDIASSTTVRDEQSAKDLLVKDEQISLYIVQQDTEEKKALDLVSSTAVRTAQSAKDLLVKDEQINISKLQQFTEAKRTLDIASSTTVRDAQSAKDLSVKTSDIGRMDAQKSLINAQKATEDKKALDVVSVTALRDYNKLKDGALKDAQKLKVDADVAFTTEQKTQLSYSVIYNNRLKTLQNYSNVIENIGMGGFVIPTAMWNTYFSMVNDSYLNWGSVPANKTFSLPTEFPKTKA